jgi:hypothetical protein
MGVTPKGFTSFSTMASAIDVAAELHQLASTTPDNLRTRQHDEGLHVEKMRQKQ